MENWSSEYVDTNGIRIHYLRTGGEKPPIVLCHGFSDNGLCWKRVASNLETRYDLIMVDARGHGLSDAPDSGYTDADHAADIAGLIEKLDIKGTAIMGHSMGAATSAAVAADYSNLVSCAVLEDPPWSSTPLEFMDPARREARRKELTEHKSRTPAEIKEFCRETHPSWHEIELDCWVVAKQQFNLHSMDVLNHHWEWDSVIDKIGCPTLIIAADNSMGALLDGEVERGITAKNSQIEVTRIDDAGHNIRREGFEAYMKTIQKFLDRHYPA